MKESVDLIEHDFALKYAVTGLAAADWSGRAGVDAEIEAENGADDTAFVETIPVLVDGGDEHGAELGFEVSRDSDKFVEFGLVTGGIPRVKVTARNRDWNSRKARERRAVLVEEE